MKKFPYWEFLFLEKVIWLLVEGGVRQPWFGDDSKEIRKETKWRKMEREKGWVTKDFCVVLLMLFLYSLLFYFILSCCSLLDEKNKRNDVIIDNIEVGEDEGKTYSVLLKYMVTVNSPLLFTHTDNYTSDNLYTISTKSTIFLTEYQICEWHTTSSSKIEMTKSWMASHSISIFCSNKFTRQMFNFSEYRGLLAIMTNRRLEEIFQIIMIKVPSATLGSAVIGM